MKKKKKRGKKALIIDRSAVDVGAGGNTASGLGA
jgi:hypothetical protein